MILGLGIELEKESLETMLETTVLTLPGLHWPLSVSPSHSSANTCHFENFYCLVEPWGLSHEIFTIHTTH
jgi:hypothetical protein